MFGLSGALLLLSTCGPATLEWRAPAECPDAARVQASLAALVQRTDFAHVRARGEIRARAGQYALRLEIDDGRVVQRRALRSGACDALAEAAALLIAIAVDPGGRYHMSAGTAEPTSRELAPELPLAVEAPASEPVVEMQPPDVAASEPVTAVARPTAPRVDRRPAARPLTRALVRAEVGLAGGTIPLAAELAGALGLLRRRLRLELFGAFTPGRPLARAGRQVGVLARWAVGVRACGRLVRGPLEVDLCGGVEAGQYLARGAGVTLGVQRARPPWLAGLVGLGLGWSPHPRVGLGVRGELVVAPLVARFGVGDEIVYTASPVGGRLGGSIELRFGAGGRGDGTAGSRPLPR